MHIKNMAGNLLLARGKLVDLEIGTMKHLKKYTCFIEIL
jgi:hypothetical protein